MRDTEDLEAIIDEYESIWVEPKIVSGWLELPGSQLPRETAKIIGQPARPARKKGASAKYSFKDAILMKLGRTLMDLGITPHRVRACVEEVREAFHTVLTGYWSTPLGDDEGEITLFLVGRETSGGFTVLLVDEEKLSLFITESGLAEVEWRQAIRTAQLKRLEALMKDAPKLDLFMLRLGQSEDYRPPEESVRQIKARTHSREDLDKLAKEEYGQIDRTDPGTPAVVQNVTRYVQDQSRQLYAYIEKVRGKTEA